ncbi:MAG: hypothetical protein ACJZ4R_02760 [Candidatus Pelagibacter sp.]|tara:strand:- start:451 stop:630 length:180 start_codon:yes stop_codon:yes gene_type:complete
MGNKVKIGDKVGMMKVVGFKRFKGVETPIYKSTNPQTIKLMQSLTITKPKVGEKNNGTS